MRLGGLVCGGRGVVTEEEMEQLKHEWVDAMQVGTTDHRPTHHRQQTLEEEQEEEEDADLWLLPV